jgi:iron-sulfur cluster assembly accessory protein
MMTQQISNDTAAMVKFTASTIAELHRLMNESGFDRNQFLRIGVKGGGCSGLSYILAFEEKMPEDELVEIQGISCIINPSQAIYLYGMEVDWGSGLDARGFLFNNPNASSTCGCGSSFAV